MGNTFWVLSLKAFFLVLVRSQFWRHAIKEKQFDKDKRVFMWCLTFLRPIFAQNSTYFDVSPRSWNEIAGSSHSLCSNTIAHENKVMRAECTQNIDPIGSLSQNEMQWIVKPRRILHLYIFCSLCLEYFGHFNFCFLKAVPTHRAAYIFYNVTSPIFLTLLETSTCLKVHISSSIKVSI